MDAVAAYICCKPLSRPKFRCGLVDPTVYDGYAAARANIPPCGAGASIAVGTVVKRTACDGSGCCDEDQNCGEIRTYAAYRGCNDHRCCKEIRS